MLLVKLLSANDAKAVQYCCVSKERNNVVLVHCCSSANVTEPREPHTCNSITVTIHRCICNISPYNCPYSSYDDSSNVMVEWLTPLLHVWEVLGSNLGPETDYPDWGFLLFSSVPPDECQVGTLKSGRDHFLLNPFQFVCSAPFHLMLYSLELLKKHC
jgi:hypothetical protein